MERNYFGSVFFTYWYDAIHMIVKWNLDKRHSNEKLHIKIALFFYEKVADL